MSRQGMQVLISSFQPCYPLLIFKGLVRLQLWILSILPSSRISAELYILEEVFLILFYAYAFTATYFLEN